MEGYCAKRQAITSPGGRYPTSRELSLPRSLGLILLRSDRYKVLAYGAHPQVQAAEDTSANARGGAFNQFFELVGADDVRLRQHDAPFT